MVDSEVFKRCNIPKDCVRLRLIRYVEVKIHSPHKDGGKCAWNSRAHDISNKFLCLRSILPFYWGILGQEVWCMVLCDERNEDKSLLINSHPLSVQRPLIVLLNWVLTKAKKIFKRLNNVLFGRQENGPKSSSAIIH